MNIIDALADPTLLGGVPAFRDLSTWRAWLVFLKACYGLPLDAAEQATFCRHTGRSAYVPPPGGWQEVVCVTGRQSGKTRIAATVAAYEALTAPGEADRTELYCVLVSQDARAALRTSFSYACAPFDLVPALARMVPSGLWRTLWKKARRVDSLTLETGCRLAVYPCRPSSVRGIRARVAIADELAFFKSSEGHPTDTEMLRALRPTLATTGGKLLVLSSPYATAGALFDLHRKHYGRDDATTLVWVASAPEMNPLLSADYLARMQQDDPEAYRSEVLGEFRAGLSTFLDPDALLACVDRGVRERAPKGRRSYVAHFDASGGRQDAAALAIAHRDGARIVLDVCRCWGSPHNPLSVIAEAADVLRRYGLSLVSGDKYGAEFVTEGFRSHGIRYVPSLRDRSQLYLELLPLVNAGAVVLLDDAELLRELRGLERRRGVAGRDKVDHGPGAHDDRAVAVAGALGGTAACCPCGDRHCDGKMPFGLLGSAYIAAWIERHPWLDAEDDDDDEDEREADADDWRTGTGWPFNRATGDIAGHVRDRLVEVRKRIFTRDTKSAEALLGQIETLVSRAPVAQRARLEAMVERFQHDVDEEIARHVTTH